MSKMSDILKDSMKAKGYVIPSIEQLLFVKTNAPNDRAIDVNAPSQAGGCMRANYYARKQFPSDGSISPRTQRIFDNGTGVHIRLQEYLKESGILLLDEVPLINDEYNIQGHTDGYLLLGNEVAILEIKSINDNGFNQLRDAKPEHKRQGMVYLYCAECRRKYLKDAYATEEELVASESERSEYFEKHYQHMKDGSRYSRKEKIANEVDLNLVSDDILWHARGRIDKVIFLYENKNDQKLKEFCVKRDDTLISSVLSEYTVLNKSCEKGIVPKRPSGATGKSSGFCRWCDYKTTCYVV